jgi:hypothetical protein
MSLDAFLGVDEGTATSLDRDPSPFPTSSSTGDDTGVLLMRALLPVLRASMDLTLYRVSVTQHETEHDTIDALVRAFAERMMMEGARGVLLAKDMSKAGAPHWYGFVLRSGGGAIGRAWLDVSGAGSDGYVVEAVGSWEMFAVMGDVDARDSSRRRPFRSHLERVIDYAFKPWPVEHGERDLDRDVIACGTLAAPWRAVRALGRGEGASAHGGGLGRQQAVAGASPKPCLLCGRALPASTRGRKRHEECRRKAHKARKRAGKGPGDG